MQFVTQKMDFITKNLIFMKKKNVTLDLETGQLIRE